MIVAEVTMTIFLWFNITSLGISWSVCCRGHYDQILVLQHHKFGNVLKCLLQRSLWPHSGASASQVWEYPEMFVAEVTMMSFWYFSITSLGISVKCLLQRSLWPHSGALVSQVWWSVSACCRGHYDLILVLQHHKSGDVVKCLLQRSVWPHSGALVSQVWWSVSDCCRGQYDLILVLQHHKSGDVVKCLLQRSVWPHSGALVSQVWGCLKCLLQRSLWPHSGALVSQVWGCPEVFAAEVNMTSF